MGRDRNNRPAVTSFFTPVEECQGRSAMRRWSRKAVTFASIPSREAVTAKISGAGSSQSGRTRTSSPRASASFETKSGKVPMP